MKLYHEGVKLTHMLKQPYNDGDCSFGPDLFVTRELQKKKNNNKKKASLIAVSNSSISKEVESEEAHYCFFS